MLHPVDRAVEFGEILDRLFDVHQALSVNDRDRTLHAILRFRQIGRIVKRDGLGCLIDGRLLPFDNRSFSMVAETIADLIFRRGRPEGGEAQHVAHIAAGNPPMRIVSIYRIMPGGIVLLRLDGRIMRHAHRIHGAVRGTGNEPHFGNMAAAAQRANADHPVLHHHRLAAMQRVQMKLRRHRHD